MAHGKISASFMRGGTSKGLVFHARDLPARREDWDEIFLAVMGSPDPHGRQLDGMGGGITSLSKVCVIGPPTRDDADIDFTFGQVHVKEARVGWAGNCGNMSAAVGPFAVSEGLVHTKGALAEVSIHNTNTRKIIRSSFSLEDGKPLVDGSLAIPGVAGTGAPIRLDFLDPGGAGTGQLLPSGNVLDRIDVPGVAAIDVSMIDAANLCVFVDAEAVGLSGIELPEALESDAQAMARLHAIGAAALELLVARGGKQQTRGSLPLIAVVSRPRASTTLSGSLLPAAAVDLCIRMLSSGQPHRAIPGTGAICTAVAMRIPGTLPHRLCMAKLASTIRLAMPSGMMEVDAQVTPDGDSWRAECGSVYRTARLLFKGDVYF